MYSRWWRRRYGRGDSEWKETTNGWTYHEVSTASYAYTHIFQYPRLDFGHPLVKLALPTREGGGGCQCVALSLRVIVKSSTRKGLDIFRPIVLDAEHAPLPTDMFLDPKEGRAR